MSIPWYYYDPQTEAAVGPLKAADLAVLLKTGVITSDTLVSSDEGQNWSPVSAVNLGSNKPVLTAQRSQNAVLAGLSAFAATVLKFKFAKVGIAVVMLILILAAGARLLPRQYSDSEYRRMAREYVGLATYTGMSGGFISNHEKARMRFFGDLINSDPAFSSACQRELNSIPVPEPTYEAFGYRRP